MPPFPLTLCAHCNAPFEKHTARHIYCSELCTVRAFRERHGGRRIRQEVAGTGAPSAPQASLPSPQPSPPLSAPRPTLTLRCPECSSTFEAKNPRALFCSSQCQVRAWRREHPRRTPANPGAGASRPGRGFFPLPPVREATAEEWEALRASLHKPPPAAPEPSDPDEAFRKNPILSKYIPDRERKD